MARMIITPDDRALDVTFVDIPDDAIVPLLELVLALKSPLTSPVVKPRADVGITDESAAAQQDQPFSNQAGQPFANAFGSGIPMSPHPLKG